MSLLTTFAENTRFQPLISYLKGITTDDCQDLTEDDFVESAEARHRLLMKLFVRQELAEFFERYPKTENFNWGPVDTPIPISDCLHNGKLDLTSKVGRFNSAYTLKDALKEIGENAASITSVDLTGCGLMDTDLADVVALVEALPSCKRVNLSSNRFFGPSKPGLYGSLYYDRATSEMVDPLIKKLLDLERIDFVDITMTPLATIDRKDFFESLTQIQLGKLIFIPERWVNDGGWTVMVPPDSQPVVTGAHDLYYHSSE